VDLDLVFLGTSASMPTAQRAPAALVVRRGGERLLFDCAEGTQRQLQRSSVGLPDLEEVFITHFHADHFLGLPGMLKTFALRGREELPLTVYGPAGLQALFAQLKPFLGRLPYPLTLVELEPGVGRPELALGAVRTEDRDLFRLELVVGQERPPAALEPHRDGRALVALESRDHARIIAHRSEGSTDHRSPPAVLPGGLGPGMPGVLARLALSRRSTGAPRTGGAPVEAGRPHGTATLATICC